MSIFNSYIIEGGFPVSPYIYDIYTMIGGNGSEYVSSYNREIELIIHGSKEPIKYRINSTGGITWNKNDKIEGIADLIERRYMETTSAFQKEYYGSYMKETTCKVCGGKRLNDSVLSVKIGGKNIYDFTIDDVKILDYDPWPAIKGKVSV